VAEDVGARFGEGQTRRRDAIIAVRAMSRACLLLQKFFLRILLSPTPHQVTSGSLTDHSHPRPTTTKYALQFVRVLVNSFSS